MIFSMVTAMAISLITERIAYRPLRKAPRLVPLITAIGASFFWQYYFRGLYGSGVTAFPTVDALKGTISIFGIEILKTQAVVIMASSMRLSAYERAPREIWTMKGAWDSTLPLKRPSVCSANSQTK